MKIERPHPRIRVFRGAIDAARCREIIDLCEASVDFKQSEIADCADPEGQHLRVDSRVRTSSEAWLKDYPETAPLQDELRALTEAKCVPVFDEECSAVPVEGRIFDPMRILRYQPGQYFRRHVDLRKVNYGYRAYASLFYLTTHRFGGELVFPTWKGLTIKPEAGTVVMYPASMQYPHEATPTFNGETKYMINCWIGYAYQLNHKEAMR